MSPKLIVSLALVPLLAACATTAPTQPKKPISVSKAVPPTKPPRPQQTFRTAREMALPGLESVIGADSRTLTQMFGTPRLNVTEGDARKLQFRGKACVLDVYLYPPKQGTEPHATYVDARRESDGQDVDRASCVAALQRR
jgi:hypothetical protein